MTDIKDEKPETATEPISAYYARLTKVYEDATIQAALGKGKERHAVAGENYEDQQACEIARRLRHSPIAGVLFQAVKKTYESSRLSIPAAKAELLGAMNYLAAGVILIEEMEAAEKKGLAEKK